MKSNISEMDKGEIVYSNLDHQLEITPQEIKESNQYHHHAAWDFCGYIYFDKQENTFIEEIWVYKEVVEIKKNDDLELLIQSVVKAYGAK